MYTAEELEIVCIKCLNAKIQDFSFGEHIEKFKVKCSSYFQDAYFLIVDVVNRAETLTLMDQSENFGAEFLHVSTQEIHKLLLDLGLESYQFNLQVNITRQYAN